MEPRESLHIQTGIRYWTTAHHAYTGTTSRHPYIVATHKRAAVDLLFKDFVLIRASKGLAVDLYAWMDKDEDIQEIMDDFQIIIDALATTPLRVDPTDWRNYKDMIWREAA